jgi:hypothetical protein
MGGRIAKRALPPAFGVVGALVFASRAEAHGVAGVRSLPIPTSYFYVGSAIALGASFAALGALWRRPVLEDLAEGRPLPRRIQAVVLSLALRLVAGVVSVSLFLLVFTAAALGSHSSQRNLAPVFLWVVFWLGLVPASIVFGNVWSALNPWRATADATVWLGGRAGVVLEPARRYPDELGRWPAAGLLLAFAALELAFDRPYDPSVLAEAIVVYSVITWTGIAVYGRHDWLENGEAFTVYFGLLSRLAPLAVVTKDGRRQLVARVPLSGLAVPIRRAGTSAFVAVMLGSVAFDGLSRTSLWLDRRFSLENWLLARYGSPPLSKYGGMALNFVGLVAMVTAVGLAFALAVTLVHLLGRKPQPHPLFGAFASSLVPIAAAYVVAHYFYFFVTQAQTAIPLLSDPLGRGWDLFGTADFRVNSKIFRADTVWYVQVSALVVGHVLGLVLAHDRAVALYGSGRSAWRPQLPMLALMVLYTVGGLWILSSDVGDVVI